jgi:hypothetical protein
MNARYAQVIADALRLYERERADLAASLIESLDQASDVDASDAWAVEVARRLTAVRSGAVELQDWRAARLAIAAD